tara:strand:- start:834 stop:1388 length:555 start_codon:yes stop_codon:yes gene_type:complete
MAIATDNRHARLTKSLLWTDNVNNALPGIIDVVEGDAKLRTVRPESFYLLDGERIIPYLIAPLGWNIVVNGSQSAIGTANRSPSYPERLKCLGGSHLVNEVKVNIEEIGNAFLAADEVLFPNFLGYGWHRSPQTLKQVAACRSPIVQRPGKSRTFPAKEALEVPMYPHPCQMTGRPKEVLQILP